MRAFAKTDIGRVRSMNQDAYYYSVDPVGNLPNLFIVADGMGGHKAGDYASRTSISSFVKFARNAKETTPSRIIDQGIMAVNQAIYSKSLEDSRYEGMGTTIVVAYIVGNQLFAANVGDSRLYLIGEEASQVTEDHSYVAEMVRAGEMTKEQARNHPRKNIITRAIGVSEDVNADYFEVDLQPGDKILLCSDGLTNMLTDEEIYRVITQTPVEEAPSVLIDEANSNGGYDNVTALVIEPCIKEDDEC